jgi:hypothetical protein
MNLLRSLSDFVQAADQDSRSARVDTLFAESGLDTNVLESTLSLLNHSFRKLLERHAVEASELAFCSFCHRSQREVRVLVTTGQVGICDQCVDIAVDTLRSTKSKQTSYFRRFLKTTRD